MISLFAKLIIKDHKNYKDPKVRGAYGILCGSFGVFFNTLLFVIKLLAGYMSGSVAIIADAVNNLSDIGSSLISIVGFKMAGKKPDPEHPFGHGRFEYVAGLIISFIIILMGADLLKTSVLRILVPQDLSFEPAAFIILIISVIIKLYMYLYNRMTAVKLSSAAISSAALDSFVDSVATTAVLLSMMVAEYLDLNVDGIVGALVSLFIIYTGVRSAKDTIDPLLGSKPDKEFTDKIAEFVTSYKDVYGVHDMLVHDYGPGRMMISLHAEVPSDGNIVELHDTIDNIERKLKEVLGCETVIHMDPIVMNEETNEMKRQVENAVKEIDNSFSIHDFRMVWGTTHRNLIFDVLTPFECKLSDDEIRKKVSEKIMALPGNNYCVINVDKPMV